jgi:hypothetical protein
MFTEVVVDVAVVFVMDKGADGSDVALPHAAVAELEMDALFKSAAVTV